MLPLRITSRAQSRAEPGSGALAGAADGLRARRRCRRGRGFTTSTSRACTKSSAGDHRGRAGHEEDGLVAVRLEEVVRRSGLRRRSAARHGPLRRHGFFDARVVGPPRPAVRQGRRRHRDRGPGELADEDQRGPLQGFPPTASRPRASSRDERRRRGPRLRLRRLRRRSRRRSPIACTGSATPTRRSAVACDVDRDKHTAIVEIDAQPGPLVHFGTTRSSATAPSRPGSSLNRVTWKPGDLYDPRDVSTTQGRLYDLGVFSSVRLDLPARADADRPT